MTHPSEGVIDHVEIPVSDFDQAKAFYREVLGHLGLDEVVAVKAADGAASRAGFGRDGYPSLWLIGSRKTGAPMHLAFRAATRKAVDDFHNHAVQVGGRDNGGPGIRTRYHANYYAAYILDADGNNIEAVCQKE